MNLIRIARPIIDDEAKTAVLRVLESGQLAQGPTVAEFEAAFARYVGVDHAVAVNSGTAALHLALLASGVGAGDEVIVPAFTYAATANAVLHCGARPVFVDVREGDFNIDPSLLEGARTARTKAVMGVHLFGSPCDVAALGEFAGRHGLVFIEDAAQAAGAAVDGRRAGSFGHGCFSFYATKNVATGEGGMVTTRDPDLAARVRLLRSQGEGQRYRTDVAGYNMRMTEVAAALGLSGLAKLDERNQRRRANAAFLSERLRGVVTPSEQGGTTHAWHQYTVRVPGAATARDALREALRAAGIEAVVFYPRPLHRQPLYRDLGYGQQSFPVAERLAEEVLSLPVHPALSEQDLERIVTAVNDWGEGTSPPAPSPPAERGWPQAGGEVSGVRE